MAVKFDPILGALRQKDVTEEELSTYAKLDGSNQPFTGDVEVAGGAGGSVTVGATPAGGSGGIDAYVKLLLHCDGENGGVVFTDSSSSGKTVTPVNSSNTSTAQKKFGTASLLLDGTTDYLTVPDSDDWNFGSGDFTIDFWYNPSVLTSYDTFMCHYQAVPANTNFWKFDLGVVSGSTAKPRFYCTVDNVAKAGYEVTAAQTFNTGTWYHLELVRNGSSVYIFINGTPMSLTTVTAIGTNSTGDFTGVLEIGRDAANSGRDVNGYMDEIRVSKGIARHTSSFTPPTAQYSAGDARPSVVLKEAGVEKWRIQSDGADSSKLKIKDADGTAQITIDQITGNTEFAGTVTAKSVVETTPTLLKLNQTTPQSMTGMKDGCLGLQSGVITTRVCPTFTYFV